MTPEQYLKMRIWYNLKIQIILHKILTKLFCNKKMKIISQKDPEFDYSRNKLMIVLIYMSPWGLITGCL